ISYSPVANYSDWTPATIYSFQEMLVILSAAPVRRRSRRTSDVFDPSLRMTDFNAVRIRSQTLSAAPVRRRSRRTSDVFDPSLRMTDFNAVRIRSQTLSAAKDPRLQRRQREADSSAAPQNDKQLGNRSKVCGHSTQ